MTTQKKTKPTAKTVAAKKPAAKPAAAKKAPVKTAPKPAAVKAPAKTVVKKPAVKASAAPKPSAKAAAKKPAAKVAGKAAPKTPLKQAALKSKAAPKPAAKKTTAPKAVKPVAKEQDSMQRLAKLIAKTLDTNKAEGIVTIPLAGRSPLADYMIIATGKSARQVGALANYVQRAFTEAGYKRLRTEGLPQGDWVVIDSGDVVVHLFRPEVRDFYQLEKLWQEEPGEPAQKKTLR